MRTNKYQTSIFGAGPLGNAIFMVNFHIPGVPSEFWDDYIKAVGKTRFWGTTKKRYAYHISQPATPAQQIVWAIFRAACDCFNKQPYSGGATPPDPGPRNRSWWFDNDPGIPPIYFNYFMKETLTLLHAGTFPIWCREMLDYDAYVFSLFPTTNYGSSLIMYVGIFEQHFSPRIYRSFIKTRPAGKKTLHLYIKNVTASGMPQRGLEVRSVSPADWEENTITWIEFTPLGDVIGYYDPPFVVGTWLEIYLAWEGSVCIKLVDESLPAPGTACWIGFATAEDTDPAKRPYLSD